ncbi:hypothetical protein PTKIN_Ptkin05aG0100200 [Pterospermum kingtungense]
MMKTNLEEEGPKNELVCDRDVGNCRCSELEEKSMKAEARCMELELEVQKRKSEYEAFETKFRILEEAKLALEEEIKVLKSQNNDFGCNDNEEVVGCGGKEVMKGVVDLTEDNGEEDEVFQLMAENRVLECEKSKAEIEAEVWKLKFKELESLTLQLQKNLVLKTEQPFDGKKSDANCCDVACGIKTSEANKSKDRSQFGTTLNDVQAVSFMDSGSNPLSPGKVTGNIQSAGTPFSDTPYKYFTSDKGDYRVQSSKRIKRHLAFQEERSPSKPMAPSTPSGPKPASVSIIDIHDSDDELDLAHHKTPSSSSKEQNRDANISANYELEGTVASETETRMIIGQNQEEKVGSSVDNVPFISVPKRKRASNIVTSDTESEDDDNIPIGKLRRMHCEGVVLDQTSFKSKGCLVSATPPGIDNVCGTSTPRKRRLVSLRQSEGKVQNCFSRKTSESKCCKGIPTTEDVEDDDSEDTGSDSESDSLNDFIVNDSDVADGENGCSEPQGGSDCNNADSEPEDVSSSSSACTDSKDDSDKEVDFDVILSRLKRNKDHKSDWKFEGEMLAAFGKDVELCMKAVCALYRQQTSGEKLWKAAFCQNQRGFSKFDAHRGCTLAEFLTDGDPQGDVKKSVEELQAYDPNAVELCRNLATRYSKQLFEIYNSKEDPYFLPS